METENSGLGRLFNQVSTAKRIPPVEKWDPPVCGTIDIRIAGDGTWFHEGRAIRRQRMVRLFASVLRKDEDGKTYLVTPVEKLEIQVDDAPLMIVDYQAAASPHGPVLAMTSNMGDAFDVDRDHPMRFSQADERSDAFKIYCTVRGRLEGLLTRARTQELMNDDRFVDLDRPRPMMMSGSLQFPLPV